MRSRRERRERAGRGGTEGWDGEGGGKEREGGEGLEKLTELTAMEMLGRGEWKQDGKGEPGVKIQMRRQDLPWSPILLPVRKGFGSRVGRVSWDTSLEGIVALPLSQLMLVITDVRFPLVFLSLFTTSCCA